MRPRVAVSPRPLSLALLGLALSAWAVAASADLGRIVEPREGVALRAGQHARVTWVGLPTEVDELELLLSVDGGRSYPVRLTPRLDPDTGAFLWQVPNLPASEARLRLRVGVGGREIDGPASAPFVIGRAAGRPVATVEARDGEWWPSRLPLPGPREGRRRLSAPAEAVRWPGSPGTADAPPSDALASLSARRASDRPAVASPVGAETGVPASRRPRTVPLRR
jgi:hypothetical protein